MDPMNSPGSTNGHDWGNGAVGDGSTDEHLSHAELSEWEHSHGEGPHGHQASLGDALDFINTLEYDKGEPDEHLTDVSATVQWLQRHELLHKEMVSDLIDRYAH